MRPDGKRATGPFHFGEPAASRHVRRVDVGGTIADKAALIDAFRQALPWPAHGQDNWDSLSDALCDLSFVDDPVLLVVHQTLPALGAAALAVYIEILEDAVAASIERDGLPWLEVFFPLQDQAQVEALLASGTEAEDVSPTS